MTADTLLLNLLVLILVLAGFVLLALAAERQGEWLLHRLPTARERLLFRLLGWPLLALALALCFMAWGWSIGAVAWLGWLTVAGTLLVFVLPWWPWAQRKAARAEKPTAQTAAAAQTHVPAAALRKPLRAWGRALAVAVMVVAPAAFVYGAWQSAPDAVMREDAFHGQVGPWSFVLAEIDRKPPEISPSGFPVKTFQIRFCDRCDDEIRTAFLKVRKPRSTRSVGLSFGGRRWNRFVEIGIPPAATLADQLWLSVEGKDGSWHYLPIDFEKVAPATAAFIKEQNP